MEESLGVAMLLARGSGLEMPMTPDDEPVRADDEPVRDGADCTGMLDTTDLLLIYHHSTYAMKKLLFKSLGTNV